MNSLTKLQNIGDQVEAKGFSYISNVVSRLLHGFFFFKKRKAEVVAGASTFFALLSFTPVILLIISLTGQILGNEQEAQTLVLNGIRAIFPELSPWVFSSVKEMVHGQLESSIGLNFVQLLFFIYAALGICNSLIFGVNTVSKVDPDQGFFYEDFKSMMAGVFFSIFVLGLVLMSKAELFEIIFHGKYIFVSDSLVYLNKFGILPAIYSLVFFTFFYKWASHNSVKLKDSFGGGLVFVSCFLAGKSSYWIYLEYFKSDLLSDYGNFYSFMVAIIWVYFLMCSFFYGAAVAYVLPKDIYQRKKRVNKAIKVEKKVSLFKRFKRKA